MITKFYTFQCHRAVSDSDLVPGAVLDLINLREYLPVRLSVKLYLFRRTLRAVPEVSGWINDSGMHPPWKWRQKYFDNVSSDDFQAAAVDYARNNPL